jgi:hypothetical protein
LNEVSRAIGKDWHHEAWSAAAITPTALLSPPAP